MTHLDKSESIESALVRSLDATNLRDITIDLAEAGVDQLLAEGIVRDIPILGTLVRLRTSFGLVRDYVFTKKVAKFLIGVAEIEEEKRKEFLKKVQERNEQRRLGETLLLLLDRLDDFEKPHLLARLFRAHLEGRCDLETFRRLSTVLDQLPLSSLPALREFYASTESGFRIGGDFLSQFAAAGVAEITFHPSDFGIVGGSFGKTELGRLFISVLDTP